MKVRRNNPFLRFSPLSPAAVVMISFAGSTGAHANTALNVKTALALDAGLQVATTYDQNLVPAATRDIVFTTTANYANNFVAGRFGMGNTINTGSINLLNTATPITLFNGNQGTAAPVTLSGGNSTSGNAADLLYVATGANLAISGFKADGIVPNTVNLILGTSGNFNVAGTAWISAPIASGTITQNGTTNNLTANTNAITKTGAGTLLLTSSLNNFTGGMTISGGVLQLGNGGTTGKLATASAIVNDANLTINRSNATVQGTDFSAAAITGAGSFIQAGSGSTTLTAANTYTGATTVNAGTLQLDGSLTSNITVNASATLTGAGSTTGSLTMNAGSTFSAATFDPAFQANGVNFAGATKLTFNGTPSYGQQTVLFKYGAGGVQSLGNLTSNFRITPQNDVANSQVVGTVTVNDLTWNSTDGTWAIGTGGWSGAPSYYDGDSVTFNERPAASTVTISGVVSPASVVVTNTVNPYTFTGSGSISGITNLSKEGAGALTLATGNTYSGGTNLEAGMLNINHASALGTGPLAIYGGGIDNTSGAALVMTNAVPQNWNTDFTFTGSQNLDMGRGLVVTGGEGSNRTVTIAAGTLTVGRLTTFGQGFTKQGPGKLEVTGFANNIANSTVTGVLNVAAGELQINRTGVAAADSGDFTAAGLTGSGTVTNGGAGSRWFYSNPTEGSFTFTGLLANGGAGGLGFYKSNAGTQILTGANTFTDVGNVVGGALVLANNTALGTPAGNTNVSTGGSLQLQGGITVAEPLVTSGQGTGVASNNVVDLNPAAPGAIRNLSGNNTLSGTVSLTSGGGGTLVRVDSGSTLHFTGTIGIINAGTNRRIFLGGAGSGDVSGVISNNFGGAGVLSVDKVDAGTWTLAGVNTYTGTTTVNAGTLVLNGSLSTGAVTVATGGTLGGNGSIGGSVTIATGGIHSLALAATPEAQVPQTITGSLTHAVASVLNLTALSAPAAGTYNLVTTTTGTITGLPDRSGFAGGTLEISPDGKTLRLVVTGGTDYGNWIGGFTFAPGADTTAAGDPDGDGVSNAKEYSFGLTPNSGASLSPMVSTLDKATGQFSYTRRKPSLTGLNYSYEFSTNLSGWTSFTPTAVVSNNGDPIETVTVTVPAAVMNNAKAFIRVSDQ
ncbi:beta strand repeat-containing protein [Luteolibacter soli]|uniref:Autotransporter-associated beta strand repeat-containing protein n=1 Tax=Luteolibacter soli TaxID=3135280 RepID=A0ABU9B2F0_9BACT